MRAAGDSYAVRMDLELRQLRAFVAVVDAGTFTDAAAVLGVSQAAVSRSVAGLEAALGSRLLHRTTRHVRLTATGTRVLGRARAVLDEVAHLRRAVERSRTELRVGYAWAAMGRHTRRIQRAWSGLHPGVPLVFVQHNSLAAGLTDGTADVAGVRRALEDPRFGTAEVGLEHRCAAVSTEHTLARRRTVRLGELTKYTMAMDDRTGTTSLGLWPPGTAPASVRQTHGTDEWLTLIAADQAVGVTSEATAHQNPRPGVAYRRMSDAPPIEVRLAWWRDDPPEHLDDLVRLTRSAYEGAL
jgi:DNA-binding transcriptional LysR family regulator